VSKGIPPGPASSVRSATGILRAEPSSNTAEIFNVIANKDVWIAYQPIVDLQRRKIFAYEALARTKSPYFAGPLPLFEAAVEHGCTGELGKLLRDLAMAGCPNAPLFINIHPSELNAEFLIRPDDAIFNRTLKCAKACCTRCAGAACIWWSTILVPAIPT
jgi:EAL domain-containing protein (putative c-di-GMP-specific phosphodiesterase class I)